MPDSNKHIARLLELVKQVADAGVMFDENSNLVEDVGLGSIQIMEIIEHIEDEFDFSFPLNDLADIKTIADLAADIERLKPGA